MSLQALPYQSVFLRDIRKRHANTGSNLVDNGSFNIDLNPWNTLNITWDAGIAKYVKTEESVCYSGLLEELMFMPKGYNTLRFKYKANSAFDILILGEDDDSPTELFREEFPAIADGLWHIVEYSFTLDQNYLVLLSLRNNSVGNETADGCGATGTAENGFDWDDVSIFKQKSVSNCGPCDTVYMDSNKPINFQMFRGTVGDQLFPNSSLDTNPFSPITTTTLAFDVTANPADGAHFTLYIGDKVFFFTKTGGLTPTDYSYTVDGNFYNIIVRGISAAHFRGNLLPALNDIVDAIAGTTTGLASSTFTMTGVAAGSYLHDPFGILSSVTSVGAQVSDLEGQNVIYDSVEKTLCYLNAGITDGFFQFLDIVAMTAGKRYQIRLEYTSDHSDWENEKVVIDDGTNPPTEISFEIVSTSTGRFLVAYFDAVITGDHEVGISVEDADPAHNSGLCMHDITVYELIDVDTVKTVDCNGTETELDYGQSDFEQNVLLQLNNSDLPVAGDTPFYIVVTDSAGNEFVSWQIILLDFSTMADCNRKNYLKMNWTADCIMADVDYSNLPFDNEFYIRAFTEKQPLDKKERVQATEDDGSISTIFNYSLGKRQVRVGYPYSDELHGQLERIFEFPILYIDDQRMYMDEASIYTIVPNGNGTYSGRIELVEAGTEAVNSSCCC